MKRCLFWAGGGHKFVDNKELLTHPIMKYFFLFLLLSFFCLGDLSAQVGINNPNPSQTLDVGGKIKVGDDQIDPVAGTIRYNRVAKTFEGFDGTEWSIFNPDPEDDDGGGATTPGVGERIRARISVGNNPNNNEFDVRWYYGTSLFSYFTTVPSGRTLRVTSILVNPTSSNSGYEFMLKPYFEEFSALPGSNMGFHKNDSAEPFFLNDPLAQMLIIPSDGHLKFEFEEFRGSINIVGYLE